MARFKSDHIHLRSPDPEAAARFYAEVLEASEVTRMKNGEALRIVMDLGGLPLFIEQVPSGTMAAPPPPFIGIEHVGLAVTGFDDIIAELKGKGVRFLGEPSSPRPGIKIAFIEGPDGVRIELLERSAA
ncbi:VOC family protein [Roseomonas sp. M0104]|uniref:VOC family protein n=1 Tax=Teichococcus coralli TaxID=2545983 RepID=A0A845B612_9PROT|nr:VOC family protein [Pseudoroseomonas coralli]MXP62085.1 VOC family protein [Pseudoroseomonas coralli]